MTSPVTVFMIACWVIFAAYWIATAFSVKKTVEKKNWFSWIYRLLAIIIMAVAITLFVKGFGGPILWPRNMFMSALAEIVTLAGLVLAIWARRTLGKNWSANVVLKEDHELVTTGPYTYVRHPIYSAILLFVLGAAIHYRHVGGFILFIMFFAGAWYKAHQEEKLMTAHFGEKYLEYKKNVKGLVPWVV